MRPAHPGHLITAALRDGYAIPAFNVSNMETVQGIVAAAEEMSSPVILQVSPGAIAYAGYATIRHLAMAAADAASVPVVVHLDHCRDPAAVLAALADGYPSVMFDGSALPLDENQRITRQLADAAHAAGAILEGELGVIGGAEDSTLVTARGSTTSPAEVRAFVEATGVDVLAPALGSLHRMPDDSVELDLDLLASLCAAAGRPVALHGASGVVRRQLPMAIAAGVAKVNVSTQVSRAMARGVTTGLAEAAERPDLRRFLGAGRVAVQAMGVAYIRLCGSGGRTDGDHSLASFAAVEEPE